jgi:hypothetical protein
MVPVGIKTLLTAVALCAPPLAAQEEVVLAVIVHETVRDSVDLATVRRVFLARQRFWRDGSPVRPVNQGARTALRDIFSRRALGGSTQDFSAYWNDLWFHGTSPPPVLGSDQAVLLYVSRTTGAIGYVAVESARDPPRGVRIALELRAR